MEARVKEGHLSATLYHVLGKKVEQEQANLDSSLNISKETVQSWTNISLFFII